MSPAIGRDPIVVIDCPDPHALASFYAEITGWPVSGASDDEWVHLDSGHTATIGFQKVEGYRAPRWPGQDVPQQLHLDFQVDDLREAANRVITLGATLVNQDTGSGFQVFLDPVGHPFCLVRQGEAL